MPAPAERGTRRGRQRLTRSADFERVYREGRSRAGRHLILYEFAGERSRESRLGLSVGRRVGGAVERNRVKRALRESFARLREGLPGGRDYVVVARPGAADLAREGIEPLERELAELLADVAGKDGRAG